MIAEFSENLAAQIVFQEYIEDHQSESAVESTKDFKVAAQKPPKTQKQEQDER